MQKRRIIKSNLRELLTKHEIDQKTLHKLSKVREATIGEMVKDENKTFARDNLNSIIDALGVKNIEELLSIVEVETKKDKDKD
jgi:DNA-binding Xre family transcriptional regulator